MIGKLIIINIKEELEKATEVYTLEAVKIHGEFVHKDIWKNYLKILAKKI